MKKPILAIAGVVLALASPAAAFDGLSVGVQHAMGTTSTEQPPASFDAAMTGAHVRYLWRSQGGKVLTGAELSYNQLDSTIPKGGGLRKETGKHEFDVSAILGYQIGNRWLPHALFGVSYEATSLHGSDGYHYGVGLSYMINDHLSVTGRYVMREFDGPGQGSDKHLDTASIMLSWEF